MSPDMPVDPADANINININAGAADSADDRTARLQRERDDLVEQLRRSQADFTNYQKRSKAQAETDRQYAIRALAQDLLSTIDNLERALNAAKTQTTTGAGSIVEGVEIVHRQLLETLVKHGVKPIQALKQPFDPNLHEALAQRPEPGVPAGTVVDELMKGYMHHDRVLRPSKVVVSAS